MIKKITEQNFTHKMNSTISIYVWVKIQLYVCIYIYVSIYREVRKKNYTLKNLQ